MSGPDDATGREVTLAGQHTLEVRRDGDADVVSLLAPDGSPILAIEVGGAGPVLRVEGAATLRLGGALRVEAEELELHGRQSVSVTSGGDMRIAASGDLSSEGLRQRITSTRGDVEVEANDDLRLDGERVMVNC